VQLLWQSSGLGQVPSGDEQLDRFSGQWARSNDGLGSPKRGLLQSGILRTLHYGEIALPHVVIWRILVNQILDFLAFGLSAATVLEGAPILCDWSRCGFLRRRKAR
jgi:hypothetical protein